MFAAISAERQAVNTAKQAAHQEVIATRTSNTSAMEAARAKEFVAEQGRLKQVARELPEHIAKMKQNLASLPTRITAAETRLATILSKIKS